MKKLPFCVYVFKSTAGKKALKLMLRSALAPRIPETGA